MSAEQKLPRAKASSNRRAPDDWTGSDRREKITALGAILVVLAVAGAGISLVVSGLSR